MPYQFASQVEGKAQELLDLIDRLDKAGFNDEAREADQIRIRLQFLGKLLREAGED